MSLLGPRHSVAHHLMLLRTAGASSNELQPAIAGRRARHFIAVS
jgi:hypothetical protein